MKHGLIIEQLSVGYKHEILRAPFLEVLPGQCIALTGRNGTGKTTFLKTLCALLTPRHGRVLLDGSVVHEMEINQRAQLISGVFHQRIPLPSLEVREVVAMGRYSFKIERLQDAKVVQQCLQHTGMEKLAAKKVSELSDGEWQKTMIARALAQQPRILLLDEPTAYLDYVARKEIMGVIRAIAANTSTAFIFSSHDLDLVEKYADIRWDVQDGMIHASHSFTNTGM